MRVDTLTSFVLGAWCSSKLAPFWDALVSLADRTTGRRLRAPERLNSWERRGMEFFTQILKTVLQCTRAVAGAGETSAWRDCVPVRGSYANRLCYNARRFLPFANLAQVPDERLGDMIRREHESVMVDRNGPGVYQYEAMDRERGVRLTHVALPPPMPPGFYRGLRGSHTGSYDIPQEADTMDRDLLLSQRRPRAVASSDHGRVGLPAERRAFFERVDERSSGYGGPPYASPDRYTDYPFYRPSRQYCGPREQFAYDGGVDDDRWMCPRTWHHVRDSFLRDGRAPLGMPVSAFNEKVRVKEPVH